MPREPDDLRAVLREEMGKIGEARTPLAQTEQWEAVANRQQTELSNAVRDLKQALTQVALYEDSAPLRRLRVSPRLSRVAFLVVDGDPAVRQLSTSSLNGAGIISTHAVASAEEALTCLRTVPHVDVILSEMELSGGMDGMLLFDASRSGQAPSARSMFFLMTTREHRKLVEDALRAGVDCYLSKPFHLDTLFDQVEKRLRKVSKVCQERRSAALRALSFIVADVDQDSRYRLQQLLLLDGIQNVTIADSGSKALRVLKERQLDVLLLDRNLLDVDWDGLRESLAEHCQDRE